MPRDARLEEEFFLLRSYVMSPEMFAAKLIERFDPPAALKIPQAGTITAQEPVAWLVLMTAPPSSETRGTDRSHTHLGALAARPLDGCAGLERAARVLRDASAPSRGLQCAVGPVGCHDRGEEEEDLDPWHPAQAFADAAAHDGPDTATRAHVG